MVALPVNAGAVARTTGVRHTTTPYVAFADDDSWWEPGALDRAADLLGPVRALRQAMIYQVFLDGIEPDERVYHSGDPAHWLRKAAELA